MSGFLKFQELQLIAESALEGISDGFEPGGLIAVPLFRINSLRAISGHIVGRPDWNDSGSYTAIITDGITYYSSQSIADLTEG